MEGVDFFYMCFSYISLLFPFDILKLLINTEKPILLAIIFNAFFKIFLKSAKIMLKHCFLFKNTND